MNLPWAGKPLVASAIAVAAAKFLWRRLVRLGAGPRSSWCPTSAPSGSAGSRAAGDRRCRGPRAEGGEQLRALDGVRGAAPAPHAADRPGDRDTAPGLDAAAPEPAARSLMVSGPVARPLPAQEAQPGRYGVRRSHRRAMAKGGGERATKSPASSAAIDLPVRGPPGLGLVDPQHPPLLAQVDRVQRGQCRRLPDAGVDRALHLLAQPIEGLEQAVVRGGWPGELGEGTAGM